MESKNKTVSVVMCTYNGAKYIREQLDSIVRQTYPIHEIIINDDISTDETVDIVKEYMTRYDNIHLSINPKRLGAHPNFMVALGKATGDYIAISDQDDIWELTKIEKQMSCIEGHALCYSLSQDFSDGVAADPECRVPNANVLRLLFYPTIPGHAMVFKRSVVSSIPKMEQAMAYDLLLALSANLCGEGGIVVCPEILNHHRRHSNAFSYSNLKNYNKTVLNIFHYVCSGIVGYFKKRDRIRNHFHAMNRLLSAFNPNMQDEMVKDSFLFSQCMSEGTFISMLKASRVCLRRRNEIFYAKTKDNIVLKTRALLWPLLCSEYY